MMYVAGSLTDTAGILDANIIFGHDLFLLAEHEEGETSILNTRYSSKVQYS